MNPILAIVLGIVALIAVIVILGGGEPYSASSSLAR